MKVTKLTDPMMEKPQNKQWNIVKTWIILTVLFLFGCFTPALSGIDGMNGGFAIITICGFLVISGIFVTVIYYKRARQLDQLFSADRPLARWEIGPAAWETFVAEDFSEDKAISKGTFILTTVISVVIGVGLSLLFQDFLMLLICLGIIVLLIFPAFAFPWFRRRRKLRGPRLVIISEQSVYVGGTYFNWEMLGANLHRVSTDLTQGKGLMRIEMRYPARTGIEHYVIRVPVPDDKWDEAHEVSKKLGF